MTPRVLEPVAGPPQLHLDMFDPQEIEAYEQATHEKVARAKARKTRLVTIQPMQPREQLLLLFDQIDDHVFDAPLAGLAAGNELNASGESAVDTHTDVDDQNSQEEWTDTAVAQLHESVLHYSLMLLQSRGNGAEKKEILKWIYAPERLVATINDPLKGQVEVVLPLIETPFSYVRCCRLCGYEPDHLQDLLAGVLKERGLGQLFNEISNG